jgi:hypothetical protein
VRELGYFGTTTGHTPEGRRTESNIALTGLASGAATTVDFSSILRDLQSQLLTANAASKVPLHVSGESLSHDAFQWGTGCRIQLPGHAAG